MTRELLRGISIFLIGMMGTGKTTVGELLAQKLNYRFFDTDILIEKVRSQTTQEIFAQDGEAGFRDLESLVLSQLCAETRSIIATGGGIVLRQKNWSYLRHGLIIWLDAPVEVLKQRLANDDTRPLLNGEDLTVKLTHILEQRLPLYSQADLSIPITPAQTPLHIVEEILQRLPQVLIPKN